MPTCPNKQRHFQSGIPGGIILNFAGETMKTAILVCLLILFSFTGAYAASVQEKDGNIFYENGGKVTQVTSLRRDSEPKLHPGGEWVYFVRSYEGKWKGDKYLPVEAPADGSKLLKEELWRVKKDGSDAKMLFRSDRAAISGPDPYVIASVTNIQFSPDGDKVYFQTSQWVTSAALWVINSDGSRAEMLGAGNDTKIVLSSDRKDEKYGDYKGCIVTSQHRYFVFGGSYDWYYIFSPDFEEIGPLGEEASMMNDFIFTDGTKGK